MNKTCCVVLAAGVGRRMFSCKPKVLSEILFEPMIEWVLSAAYNCNVKNICVVTGFMHERVEKSLNKVGFNCDFALQNERKGTAHAVMMAQDFLKKHSSEDVLILNGDSPFIDEQTIFEAYKVHKKFNNSSTIISSILDNPYGYGRIIRDDITDEVKAIVEEKEADFYEKQIREINSGAYWFKVDNLLEHIYEISNNTVQNEYYLTDVIKLFIENGLRVDAFKVADSSVVMGANDCKQLKQLNTLARNRVFEKLISNGVNIPCVDGVIIGRKIVVEEGTTILPNTILRGNSKIGRNCVIGPNSQLDNCIVEENAVINSSYCKNSFISCGQKIGPFETMIDIKNFTVVDNAVIENY